MVSRGCSYKPKYDQSRALSTEGKGLLIRGMVGEAAGCDRSSRDGCLDESQKAKKTVSRAVKHTAGSVRAPVDLGGGWVELFDESRGRAYFFNRTTRETTWETPI